MKHTKLCLGMMSASVLLVAWSVQADTVDDLMRQLRDKGVLTEQEYNSIAKKPDAVGELLSRLQAKGILTKGEYNALSERHAAEPRPAPAVAPVAPSEVAAAAPPATFVRMMEKGVGLHVGPVDVVFSGNINAFYVHDLPERPGSNTTVLGGLANVGGSDSAAVRNGLLPGNFSVNLKTHQQGLDIGLTFGLYPGLNSVTGVGGANSAGNPQALGTSGIDFRQQFITVGTEGMGTFKAGRDIGMFGQEAILNDFSLLGVGSPGSNRAPSNTSLGRIGLGYVYTDFIPQISYMSPSFGGLKAGIGVFTPLEAVNFSTVSGALTAHDEPGFQGKLTYDLDLDPVKTKLWTNFVTQKLKSASDTEALPEGDSVRAYGFDLGGLVTFGPADLMLYGYFGKGLGSTGLFFDAVSPSGKRRDSKGFIVQGTYKLLNRLTIGASHGVSYLDLADNEVNPLLVERNASQLVGVHYELTSWLKLVAEYIHTKSVAHGDNEADENTVTAGTILFF